MSDIWWLIYLKAPSSNRILGHLAVAAAGELLELKHDRPGPCLRVWCLYPLPNGVDNIRLDVNVETNVVILLESKLRFYMTLKGT